MAGYSRQSTADIVPTAVVRSAPVNAEFNAIRDAFAFSGGHKHDGSSTEGGYIPLIADTDANNKVSVDTSSNRVVFYSEVSSSPVAQLYVQDGVILPATDNDIDLGSSSAEFKDLYLDGTAKVDTLTVDENATIAGTLGVTGVLTATGGLTGAVTGNVTGDVVGNLTGNVTGNLTGSITSTSGSSFGNVDINGGTIDGASIGATNPATVSGTVVTATTQFTGDLVGNVTGNVTGSVTGNVTGDLTGDVTGNVAAATGTSSFNDVTVNGTLDVTGATIANVTDPVNPQDAATKSYVDSEVAALVDTAPGTLDTLNELAAALGDDPDFATTVTDSLATKLPLAGGTMSGAIAMGTNKITGVGDPVANQDAATKVYTDTQDATKLSLSGGTLTGNIVMGGNKVTSTATPTADDDLTRKGYVDAILGSATSAADSAAAAATSETNAAISEVVAAASTTDAESARDQSQSARDTANLHKIAAEAAATSATNTAAALTGFDLDAIAETKAVTAVDVFVYDTSKDSDGGAWRKRTQHTSWYNETLNTATRGGRREFPAVAVIVAESDKVTIYDGDDPSLPMWMTFTGTVTDTPTYQYAFWTPSGTTHTARAVTALNGLMCFAVSSGSGHPKNGLCIVSFFADELRRVYSNSSAGGFGLPVVDRSALKDLPNRNNTYIVNSTVNDVAMTVLPDAPIDPATGLPVPTIAVATAGGVSVIKDDGTVVDSASTDAMLGVTFTDAGLYYTHSTTLSSFASYSDIDGGDGFGDVFTWTFGAATGVKITSRHKHIAALKSHVALGPSDTSAGGGIHILPDIGAVSSTALRVQITSTYNTGWMNGNIKGAFLSSTDTASLVGSGELVTNGTFDTDTDWTKGIYWTISGGVATHAAGTGSDLEQAGIMSAGRTYILTLDVTAVRAASTLYLMSGPSNTYQVIEATVTAGTKVVTFVAPANGKLVIRLGGPADVDIDNISVKLADADEDRSVNANGLIVNGTITRSPVATGAELVGYSGFSASNYLEQPYNPDLDFGTGDFCVMGWVNGAGSNDLLDRTDGSNTLRVKFAGDKIRVNIAGVNIDTPSTFVGGWKHIVYVRKSGVGYIYGDGALLVSGSQAGNVGTNMPTRIGNRFDGTAPFGGSMALWRISATAPTAEQIAKIYEDEKVLFQENAQATLYGSSDAVTALAHDPDTGLLHVGTSAGRSVFQGLRRVSNTTTAVGTAISASNGLVVEE